MFIEVTQIQNGKELGKRFLNLNKVIYFGKSLERCNVICDTEALLIKESYEEVKDMMMYAIENAKSFNNIPWSSLSEETREAFLDELKQAREGLESRLGDK